VPNAWIMHGWQQNGCLPEQRTICLEGHAQKRVHESDRLAPLCRGEKIRTGL